MGRFFCKERGLCLQAQTIPELEKIDTAMNKLFLYLDVNDLFNSSIQSLESLDFMKRFDDANEEDMNTPNGVTVINDLVKEINLELRGRKDSDILVSYYNVLKEMLYVYGLNQNLERMSLENRNLYNEWIDARKKKDFSKADELRNKLLSNGVKL